MQKWIKTKKGKALNASYLKALKDGKAIKKPVYSFEKQASAVYQKFSPSKTIILEGLFAFQPQLLQFINLRVFVEAPTATRLSRRIERDTKERNLDKEAVTRKFQDTIQPKHRMLTKPLKRIADLVINQSP